MKAVLIVDDSKQIRDRIVSLLADSDQIRVAGQAGTRAETMEALEHLRPDVVILDIRLPDGSGIDLLKTIKHRNPEIRVIMLTLFDDALYRRQCRLLGADRFLSKTLEFDRLADAVLDRPAP